ncbi:MFS transporter [Cryobacterium arcticum]|uniref:MFS transporter n=1 Tax=Cryobacterium arcticum TaxID=670052 RepID=A0A318A0L8_9MICO|nr:MFS transporter [Cryobacterium arcticum]PXA73236.1 MFS transporter [Cryobacterium arcticum]
MSPADDARRRRLVVAACSLSVFIVSTDTNTVNVALPALQADFAVPLTSLQFLVSAYTMALASFYLLSGTVGDRFGRRTVLLSGLGLFAIGSVLCAAAWSFPILVAFRVIQAVGAAMLAPMAIAILNDEFTDRAERARAIGTWAIAGGLGAGFGPVAGGLLVTAFGWRSIYWATTPFAVLALVLGLLAIRNVTGSTRPALNLGTQALLATALCSLLVVTVHAGSSGFDGVTVLAIAVLVGAVAALVFTERRNRTPLLDARLFRRGPFTGALVAIMSGFFLLGGVFFLSSFFLQTTLGVSALVAGLAMTAWSLGSILSSRFIGQLASRRPAGFFYALTGILATVGIGMMLIASGSGEVILALVFVTVGLFGAGAAFSMANTSTSIFGLEGVAPDIMGRAAAFLSVARQVAQSLGVALTSLVFDGAGGSASAHGSAAYVPAYLFVVGVVVLLLCLVPVAGGWHRRRTTGSR